MCSLGYVFMFDISLAGTLDVDYKERIINYMGDNGLKFWKDVDLTELTNQPGLEGIMVRIFFIVRLSKSI